ncbi:unnamed protein product [marine sediment metagenome]|uniref:Uncharacterized protein n=1 Tax=marine sediment metagenome TaxID=412755 RepID=X1IR12_9ZZZZ
MSWPPVGSKLLSLKLFKKKVYQKNFAARLGSGGEVYIGAEGLREDRYCTGGCDR